MSVSFENYSGASSASATNLLNVGVPSGSGTLLIGWLVTKETGITHDVPSGWIGIKTNIRKSSSTDDGTLLSVWYRIVASEPSSYNFTWSAGTSHAAGQILRYRDAEIAAPIQSSGSGTGTGPDFTAPSLNATYGTEYLLGIFGGDGYNPGSAQPGFTPRYSVETSEGAGAKCAAVTEKQITSTGATGVVESYMSSSASSDWSWSAVSVLLEADSNPSASIPVTTTVSAAPSVDIALKAKLPLSAGVRAYAGDIVSYTIRPEGPFSENTWITLDDSLTHGLDTTLTLSSTARPLIRIPLRKIRTGSQVIRATLTLTVSTNPAADMSGVAIRLKKTDWDPLTADWYHYRDTLVWDHPGTFGLFPGFPYHDWDLDGAVSFQIGAAASTVTVNIRELVQDALDNRGQQLDLVLYPQGNDSASVYSGRSADISKAPSLAIDVAEDGLGYPYTGAKRIISNWIAGRESQAVGGLHMGIGVGTSPATGQATRRRLESEVARVPVIGVGSAEEAVGDVWAHFPAGAGVGNISEIALFPEDTTTMIEDCESIDNWSWAETDPGFFGVSPTGAQEGSFGIRLLSNAAATDPVIRSGLTTDLTGYSLDDYVALGMYSTLAYTYGTINQLDLRLTDDNGTWLWNLDSLMSADNVYYNLLLKFGDATFDPTITGTTVTGPGTLSELRLVIDFNGDAEITIDNIRALKGAEDVLLWVPPASTIAKSLTQARKIRVRLSAKKGKSG